MTKNYIKTKMPSIVEVISITSLFHLNMVSYNVKSETHDFWELMYLDKGYFELDIEGETLFIDEGQMIIYAPNLRHCSAKPVNANINVVAFNANFPDPSFFETKIFTLTGSQKDMLAKIMNTGEQIFVPLSPTADTHGMIPNVNTTDYELQIVKNRLELFLIELYKSSKPTSNTKYYANHEKHKQEQLSFVIEYFRNHITENLSLEKIASDCSLSTSKLKHLFRELCDCGPVSYFTSLKLLEAKNMIANTSKNFTQISEELGFGTVHHFSYLFKKKTGVTPSDYAKSINKN